MLNFFTVIPLQRFGTSQDTCFDFTADLILRPIPEWIKADKFINSLGYKYSAALGEASYGFIVEYEAASPADTDSSWLTGQPKPIQETKYELAVLANLAIWLSCPSPVCFAFVFHGAQPDGTPTINRVSEYSPLLCHPNDINAMPSSEDINLARTLHSVLVSIPKNSAIWTAVRASWAALQSNMEEVRYSLLWIALEALFGPEDAREITYRLAQRVAALIVVSATSAREIGTPFGVRL